MSQDKAQQYVKEYEKIHELTMWNLQYPTYNLELPGMQKYQKNLTHNHEEKQLIERDPKRTKITEIAGSNIFITSLYL